jgi:2-isopropylmalate synthase
VEATINGIGERAGNTSLEETVMAIRTRADYFNLRTDINAREFSRTSLLVSELLGIPVPPNKAIVGANAFSHSSGIHVDGFLKDRQTYEIMRPEDVGLRESRVVLTARTGRAGLRARLEKLGFTLSPKELNQAYTRFLSVADKKQEVFDEDLMAMVHEELQPTSDHCQLVYLQVSGGTSSVPTASVRLTVQGESREATSTGDGPIDAVYKALSAITHSSVKLLKYEIRSVTSGTEALGEATVHLQQGEVKIVGRGASTDIIEASAKAYVDGVNKLARVSAAIA